MTRLVLRALIAGLVTAVLLVQLQRAPELVAWELLLVVFIAWQIREIPGSDVDLDPPLFEVGGGESPRLPRSVSAVELAVVDALNGHLSPERRLKPLMRRIARHRLARLGISLESSRATELLGETSWAWLSSETGDRPAFEELDEVVSRLEEL